MNEFKESGYEEEVSEEEFKQQVIEKISGIWEQQGWKCQREVNFTDKLPKYGGEAVVQRRPKDPNNPEDILSVLFFVGQNSRERQELQKSLNFVISHEISHIIQGIHKNEYEIEIPRQQFDDLNNSKKINPEHFYSGANEVATDVIAFSLVKKEGERRKVIESLLSFLTRELIKSKEGGKKPIYRDQARFEVLMEYVKDNQLIDNDGSEEVKELFDFWSDGRASVLDNNDQERFEQMKEYLKQTVVKAEKIAGNK